MKATLYRIDGPWPGFLAILPRPRGGDWLEDEIKAWLEAGIDVVLSALGTDAISELDLQSEPELCLAHGIEWINSPIADRGVPAVEGATKLPSNSEEGLWAAIQHWCRLLTEIRQILPDAEWEASVDDHDIYWDPKRRMFDPSVETQS